MLRMNVMMIIKMMVLVLALMTIQQVQMKIAVMD